MASPSMPRLPGNHRIPGRKLAESSIPRLRDILTGSSSSWRGCALALPEPAICLGGEVDRRHRRPQRAKSNSSMETICTTSIKLSFAACTVSSGMRATAAVSPSAQSVPYPEIRTGATAPRHPLVKVSAKQFMGGDVQGRRNPGIVEGIDAPICRINVWPYMPNIDTLNLPAGTCC